jgi:hypothetical protein
VADAKLLGQPANYLGQTSERGWCVTKALQVAARRSV